MYNSDPTLLERFNERLQTKFKNNDPNPLVYITRNTTAITTQKFWEKHLITSMVGGRISIAARRPENSFLADMIFVAQIESGTAVVKRAEPKINLLDIVWSNIYTLEGIIDLSLVFDGTMREEDGKVEIYTKGELPYIFYVDSLNSLKYVNLDDEDISGTIAENVAVVSGVRGLYASAIDLDDGIWCFYITTAGALWEAQILDGVVAAQTQISLLPTGVTTWTNLWAGITFDYRIILQLKGDDGNVYTLVSKSRTSGYANLEYLMVRSIEVSGLIGYPPPDPLYAENMEV